MKSNKKMELAVKELTELKEVIENIEKTQGMVLYIYLESVGVTKIYLNKFTELANEIKKINPVSKVVFAKINAEKAKEIKDFYEVDNFPCICIYYLRDQKTKFIPKD